MLNEGTVFATIAVSDIATAKDFYGRVLGLNQVDENPGGIMYVSGGGRLFIYQSTTAGTGQATSASWEVADIESTVEDLAAKGIMFEHYEMPNTELHGDIHVMGPMKAAWFKDPDGNILAVNNSNNYAAM